MAIEFELVKDLPENAELVGVPVASDETDRPVPTGARTSTMLDANLLAALGFEGKLGETAVLPGVDAGPALVAVGVGPAADVDATVLRRAAAFLSRASSRVERLATTLPGAAADGVSSAVAAQAVAEGVSLGAYRFTRHRSDPKPSRLATVSVVGGGGARVRDALERGARVAAGVGFARDLVNEPGGTLTPPALADAAKEMAEREDLQADILDERAIVKAGLGGLMAVNRGSSTPARFVELTFEPDTRPRATVALVGKGITFDSGGLSLKTNEGMLHMKGDMGGAAAILGALSAVRAVSPRVRVRAYLPMTDNMPGGDATRVGDVIRIFGGKTVEVLNTDAEGRLILADALARASADGADAIVDLATLTGACVVALGAKVAGLMGDHDGWLDQVQAAADRAGEPVWPLPLPAQYRKALDSKVADLRNVTNGRYGGALYAGLFLKEFVGDGTPWAHLDIAGPAFGDDDDGEISAGGTGFGVRTLLELLASYKRP